MGERALWWVQRYLHHVRPQLLVNPHCKALFVALDGVEGLTPNGITNTVSHWMKASGLVAHGSCHLFRHAMATQMLENGADLRWIQAMLGHASVESTQIYTQVSVRALQAVHATTHPAERDVEALTDEAAAGINSGDSLSAESVFTRLSEKYRRMAKDDNTEE